MAADQHGRHGKEECLASGGPELGFMYAVTGQHCIQPCLHISPAVSSWHLRLSGSPDCFVTALRCCSQRLWSCRRGSKSAGHDGHIYQSQQRALACVYRIGIQIVGVQLGEHMLINHGVDFTVVVSTYRSCIVKQHIHTQTMLAG